MNARVMTYSLAEDFIGNIADYVDEKYIKKDKDMSRLAFVFEGKRPGLFLKKTLATKKLKNSFQSPAFFSIDDFIHYTLSKKIAFKDIPKMEAWHLIYTLAKSLAPEIVKGRERFSQFLTWAREIAKFIDMLDLEDVKSDALKNLQASASIGYDIPENINASLKNIIALRDAYHEALSKGNSLPHGFIYLCASRVIEEVRFDEFDKIFFCGLFYMPKTEEKIVRYLYDSGKADLFFQGDMDEWPILKRASLGLSVPIKPAKEKQINYDLKLYAAFDAHSQCCAAREIVARTRSLESTVVVLPDHDILIPLISEIAFHAGEFNVSLGYPLKRSSLYSLFEFVVQAQKRKKPREYYARDYLAALRHPLAKNLKILPDYGATRVLVHKVEEVLSGIENLPISGSSFIKLKDIENEGQLFTLAAETLGSMGIEARPVDLQKALVKLHRLLFGLWEDITNFREFAMSLKEFLDAIAKDSFIEGYPLNLNIAERLYNIADEMLNAPFSGETFAKEDIFKIFKDMLEDEVISFSGSPLKGLQVLGLLETRSLNFENVIVVDANEPHLPSLRIYNPLIPNEVTMGLGLDVIGREEEIQRYFFTRIISSAKDVHLIYEENPEKARSRFLEGLIWKKEKEANKFGVVPVPQIGFTVKLSPPKGSVEKTKEMVDFLKNFTYSASALNTYLECPLQFYYSAVLELREKEDLLKEPDAGELGNFVHEFLEAQFKGFVGKKPEIDAGFEEDFFRALDKKFKAVFSKRLGAESFLLKEVLDVRLKRFLKNEKDRKPGERDVLELLGVESKIGTRRDPVIVKLGNKQYNFTGKIDRIDKLEDGTILIVDYKTGRENKPTSTEAIEEALDSAEDRRRAIKDNLKSFQLPLYIYFVENHFKDGRYKDTPLNAALYSLRDFSIDKLLKDPAERDRAMALFMKALELILDEILDPAVPFVADPGNNSYSQCNYCPFFYLCR